MPRTKRIPLYVNDVKGNSSGGGGSSIYYVSGGGDFMPVQNKTGNYACTTADLETVLTMTSAVSALFRLPHVDATHIGYTIEFHKLGAGELVIGAEDADTINGTAYFRNNMADDLFSVIRLRLITATAWDVIFMSNPLGWWNSAV